MTTTAARRAWAKSMLAGVGDRPVYGSPEWVALPESDPGKVAAAVIAAECWASDLDDLPQRLAIELEAMRVAEEARWAELHARAVRIAHQAATPAALTLRRHYAQTPEERAANGRRPRPSDRNP